MGRHQPQRGRPQTPMNAASRRVLRSVVRIAFAPDPGLGALSGDPGLGFGLALEAGDRLGLAAGPDRPYVPLLPVFKGLCLIRDFFAELVDARQDYHGP